MTYIRIYSVGVWNYAFIAARVLAPKLEFTPLEFETHKDKNGDHIDFELEFTPLEFETLSSFDWL